MIYKNLTIILIYTTIIGIGKLNAQNLNITDWKRDGLKGKICNIVMIEQDTLGNNVNYTIFKYSKFGVIKQKEIINSHRIKKITWIPCKNNTYTNNNNLWYGYDGNTLINLMIISYDERGYVKEEKMFDAKNELSVVSEYKRDSSGVIECNTFLIPYKNPWNVKYINDKNGNPIKENEENNVYIFDHIGNWIKKETYLKGNLVAKYVREIRYY